LRKLTALVIGNAAYLNTGTLANTVNDANDVADILKTLGFTAIILTDGSCKEMDLRLRDFRGLLHDQDVGLFFFAGHGLQFEGENFLTAIDTKFDNGVNAKYSALPLNKVIDVMKDSGVSTSIVILDACRDNPWQPQRRSAASEGLAPVYAPKGTLIAYSTSPGEIAMDGLGRNGPYTEALLQHIDAPEVPIETMFKRVRNTLAAATQGKQTSWEHTSLSGEFFFNLSIANLVQAYGITALSDKRFMPDADLCGELIKGLKVQTAGRQDAALKKFDSQVLDEASTDSLFVLGRNIYQAACGSVITAMAFIESFVDLTSGMKEGSRKPLLDGMLFEIFFGPEGKLRKYPKTPFFNQVFELQLRSELAASFEFIAQCLAREEDRFYAIPGTNHGLAVTVTVTPDKAKGVGAITGVYFGSRDVLRDQDDMVIRRNWNSTMTYDELREELSGQMLAPKRSISLTINPSAATQYKFILPSGRTVRKY
jgi:hypothetical protein